MLEERKKAYLLETTKEIKMRNPIATVFPQRHRRSVPGALQSFREMENEMDRWFRKAPLGWADEYQGYDFVPACNIDENSKEYIVKFDMPGIKKKDVSIELENNRLTVSGERKEKKEEKDVRHYLSESYYGTFMRAFNLSAAVDDEGVEAHYDDGVLTIRVPKMEASKSKAIKIH